MKLSTKQEAMLKSYARGVLTAITPLLAIRSTDLWAYVAAVVAGVIAPARYGQERPSLRVGRGCGYCRDR
jgi:hypothetical protein